MQIITYIHVHVHVTLLFFYTEVRGAALWLPELWILRYPAQRYHVVPSPGFEPTTLLVVSPTSKPFDHDALFKGLGFLRKKSENAFPPENG
jgi:hypothetical protein